MDGLERLPGWNGQGATAEQESRPEQEGRPEQETGAGRETRAGRESDGPGDAAPERSEAAGWRTLDPGDWAGFREQAHAMLDAMLGYTEGIRERPVWQAIPDGVRERFRGEMPRVGAGVQALQEVQAEFMGSVVPYTAANGHPGFMGWAQGGGTPVGMLAEMLAAGLNANVGGRDQIPLEVERQVTEWMRVLFGFPEGASGIFLTGSSMANFVAVVVARYARLGVAGRREGVGDAGLRAYASAGVHGSVGKALDLAGLGSGSLRKVGVDGRGRMSVAGLERAIAEDRATGLEPFLVVGTAGTVDTGAIDELERLAEVCEREGLWLHVDGAVGALGMMSAKLAPRLKGLERASSVGFDFHKWGQVPYDAGFLLVRDGAMHRGAFATPSAYLAREERGMAAGGVWPCELGPELSRSFRALKVWMTLKVYGADAMGKVMEQTCELAAYLESRVSAAGELELMAPVELNVVCFRYKFDGDEEVQNRLTRELVMRLQEGGEVAPSATTLEGRVAIRAAVVNHRTSRVEMDRLVEKVLAGGRALRPEVVEEEERLRARQRARREEQEDLRGFNERLAEPGLAAEVEVDLRVRRAMLLAHLGRSMEARSDHLRVLELAPAHKVNLLELGRLLMVTGQKNAAKVVYTEAVRHYPEDLAGRVGLGSVLLQSGDPAGAREQYEVALGIDPELPQAHGGMYYALSQLGELDVAAVHRQKGFGRRNLFETPYRGEGRAIPVVLLVASAGGNTPIEKLLDDTVFQTHVVVADFYDRTHPLPAHELIFNGIGDVDVALGALVAAHELAAESKARVLNAPAAVMATSRCENARRLAEVLGVRTAKTAVYPYARLAGEDGAETLVRDGFRFPVLLRVPGFHMGEHFVEVEHAAALAEEVAKLPGKGRAGAELLAIEYLDARGEDGCARKYRVMMVGGKLYPLHLAISPNWKIHYFSADMADRPDHRAEEERFLTDMPGALGRLAMAGLMTLQERLGLDYGGIDFGLSKDGEVLLFEANATMVVEQPDDDPRWDYRRAAVSRIHEAVRAMLTGGKA